MTVHHQSKITVNCGANPVELAENCKELESHGAIGSKGVEILREIGSLISKLDEVTGTIRLVMISAADGGVKSSLSFEPISELTQGIDLSASRHIKLAAVELSTRARKILNNLSASTLGDVEKFSETDLLKRKMCGTTTTREIKRVLARYGLFLKASSN